MKKSKVMQSLIRVFCLILGAFIAVCGVAAPNALAEYRGLIIGINKYKVNENLRGAVEDARDIAGALQRFGVRDIRLLLDDQANHQAIKRAWRDMIDKAQPGDTLIFTYAGHGGQEPEKIPGSEKDGKDETFLLGGFDVRTKAGIGERIVDNEIYAWFQLAGDKGLRVIFIADSCYSGTMTRTVDMRAKLTFRNALPYELPEDMPISEEMISGAGINEDDMKHVLFIAATQEHRKTPEIPINGKPRGVLSWAFSRALEGLADADHNGDITRFELENYIVPTVRHMSEAHQTPVFKPRSVIDEVVFSGGGKPASLPEPDFGLPRISMAVLNMEPGKIKALIDSLNGVDFAGLGMVADLIWDADKHDVISSAGDILAHNIGRAELSGVAGKWRTLTMLKQLAGKAPLKMSMSPGDARQPEGRAISFSSAPLGYDNMTLFNLSNAGIVQFLYPLSGDNISDHKGKPLNLKLEVKPPFGADHLILIASDKPLISLHGRLEYARASNIAPLVAQALKGMKYQIGIQSLFTYSGEK